MIKGKYNIPLPYKTTNKYKMRKILNLMDLMNKKIHKLITSNLIY